MVGQNTLRTCEVNHFLNNIQNFRIAVDVNKCLEQIISSNLLHAQATISQLPSNTSTLTKAEIAEIMTNFYHCKQ